MTKRLVVILLLFARSIWGFQLLLTTTPTERRQKQLARLLGETETFEVKAPKGSRVVASRTDAGTLVVQIPAKGVTDISPVLFAIAWFGVVGMWTAEVVVASPIMALFSTPFWLAGGQLLTKVVDFTETRLTIGEYAWELEYRHLNGLFRSSKSGSTSDLDYADISHDAYIQDDRPITSVRLTEGANVHHIAGLGPVEENWLTNLINDSLNDLKSRPHVLPPPSSSSSSSLDDDDATDIRRSPLSSDL